MRVSKTFRDYNRRRNSKPWICKIMTWKVGEKPDLKWGEYLGDAESGGEAEIEAEVGDIVRAGQKDYRQPRDTISNWYVVGDAGELITIAAKDARRLFDGKQQDKQKPCLEDAPSCFLQTQNATINVKKAG